MTSTVCDTDGKEIVIQLVPGQRVNLPCIYFTYLEQKLSFSVSFSYHTKLPPLHTLETIVKTTNSKSNILQTIAELYGHTTKYNNW